MTSTPKVALTGNPCSLEALRRATTALGSTRLLHLNPPPPLLPSQPQPRTYRVGSLRRSTQAALTSRMPPKSTGRRSEKEADIPRQHPSHQPRRRAPTLPIPVTNEVEGESSSVKRSSGRKRKASRHYDGFTLLASEPRTKGRGSSAPREEQALGAKKKPEISERDMRHQKLQVAKNKTARDKTPVAGSTFDDDALGEALSTGKDSPPPSQPPEDTVVPPPTSQSLHLPPTSEEPRSPPPPPHDPPPNAVDSPGGMTTPNGEAAPPPPSYLPHALRPFRSDLRGLPTGREKVIQQTHLKPPNLKQSRVDQPVRSKNVLLRRRFRVQNSRHRSLISSQLPIRPSRNLRS